MDLPSHPPDRRARQIGLGNTCVFSPSAESPRPLFQSRSPRSGGIAGAGVARNCSCRGLADLPHFNPDLDGEKPPLSVIALREAIAGAQALMISSPEYARGVAGSLKNALDWLVGSTEFPGKPVAVINVSPRASHADAALRLTLQTMSAEIIEDASITLPLLGRNLDAQGIVADAELSAQILSALQALKRAIAPEDSF
jgi:chromate reductase